jgi:hypothetical protein
MANLLFRTVRKLLLDMLADPKYLGARPGIILALHTWGQTLALHPHLHCLITGGGLDGEHWKAVNNGFLLPVVLLMEKFRAQFLKALRRAVAKGKLRLPPGQSRDALEKVFAKIEKIKWNVHIRERYPYGEGVVHYLARYLRGGPIGNSRLLPAPEGKVRFKYYNNHDKDEAGRGKPDTMTLPTEQFLQRLFLHVPPPRMQTVRACGLYASSKTEALDRCRALLGQAPVEKPQKTHWQDACADNGETHPECCPVCGKRLIHGETIPPEKKKPKPPPRLRPRHCSRSARRYEHGGIRRPNPGSAHAWAFLSKFGPNDPSHSSVRRKIACQAARLAPQQHFSAQAPLHTACKNTLESP